MAKTISVGCKLPQGLILEGGYTNDKGGVSKTDKYFRIELKGANQHSAILDSQGNRSASPRDLKPGITNGVDEAAFDEWVKNHADTNIVKNGLVFKAANAAEANAQAIDLTQKKTGLESLDPTKVQNIVKRTDE